MKPRLTLGCRRWGSEPVPSKSGRRGGRFSGGLALCGGQCEAEAGAAVSEVWELPPPPPPSPALCPARPPRRGPGPSACSRVAVRLRAGPERRFVRRVAAPCPCVCGPCSPVTSQSLSSVRGPVPCPWPGLAWRRGGRSADGGGGTNSEAPQGVCVHKLDLEMQWQWMERVFLWRSILIFRVSLLVCTAGNLFAQATCPDITVTQQLLKEGFHRDLLTKVELGAGDEAIGSCTVAIKEHLPTGLYVDPYELASLQQHNLTEALMIPDIVDVESPEYLATDLAIVVYMKPDPQCASCFKAMLPVHCRYHRPTEDDGEALTLLKSPEILIHCHKSFPSVECWKYSEVEAPCSVRNRHTCHWNIVKYKHVNTEVILKVPVGLKQHGTLVCAVTLLTTVLCSSLVLAAVCKYGHFSLVHCSE